MKQQRSFRWKSGIVWWARKRIFQYWGKRYYLSTDSRCASILQSLPRATGGSSTSHSCFLTSTGSLSQTARIKPLIYSWRKSARRVGDLVSGKKKFNNCDHAIEETVCGRFADKTFRRQTFWSFLIPRCTAPGYISLVARQRAASKSDTITSHFILTSPRSSLKTAR